MTPHPNSVILSEASCGFMQEAQSKNPETAHITCSSRPILPRTLTRLLLTLLPFTLPAPAQPAPPTAGAAIYTLTQQFLAAAPKRFNGSPGHLAAESFIKDHFKPEAAQHNLETDEFTAQTPVGPQVMRNYIVRFPGKKQGVIVLASHYETNYPLKDIPFVGANDGACTSALLIWIGQYLRTHPPQGYGVWLVFDDGEEAVANPPYDAAQWSGTNNLYGTRHLAAKWSADGTLLRIKAFLLADMIGDKDLNIDYDEESTPWLRDLLKTAAKNTGHLASIYKTDVPGLGDDHIPFKQRGVPVLDLIDIDYGPRSESLPDGYHHTQYDTLDKLSPKSLQTSADLFLELIHLLNQH